MQIECDAVDAISVSKFKANLKQGTLLEVEVQQGGPGRAGAVTVLSQGDEGEARLHGEWCVYVPAKGGTLD